MFNKIISFFFKDPSFKEWAVYSDSPPSHTCYKSHRDILIQKRPLYQNLYTYIQGLDVNSTGELATKLREGRLEKDDFKYLRKRFRKDFISKNLDSLEFTPSTSGTLSSGVATMLHELDYYKTHYALSHEEKQEIENAIQHLTKVKDLAIDLQTVEDLQSESKREALQLLECIMVSLKGELERLKLGQKFFIPGGTKNHLMLYEVVCTSERPQKFTFKVFNSGTGIDYHSVSVTLSGMKFYTYTIENVTLDQLIDFRGLDGLLRRLIDISQGIADPPTSFFRRVKEALGCNDRYVTAIYRLIDLKLGTQIKPNSSTLPHKMQNQGSCARKAYNFALREEFLGPLNYRKFKVAATELSIQRLKTLNELERTKYANEKYVHTTEKTHRLTRWLFHTSLVARLYFYFFKKEMSNEALIDLGQTILEKRQHKVNQTKQKISDYSKTKAVIV